MDLEKLKQDIEAYKQSEQEASEIIAELKAENEKLREDMKNNKSAYEVELGTYNMECGNLLEENKQLFHTLQEIKEIISRTDSHHPPSVANMVSIIRHKLYELTKAEEEWK